MDKVIKQNITDTLEQNYMPYAMSVIVSRAIPEIDGFKPSHRKLLYTMYKMNLIKGNRTKSANVVGQTMKLNPHGDQAIYETLVRLTKGHEALLHPYIDSKGNFGKSSSRDMKYAASRYTEVKLDELCEELFKDIDKDTVDFVDNYDGQMKEPLLLPTTYPNILVNPNKGIAVGMASNFCSFNLGEICDTTSALLDSDDVDLLTYLKAPDFATGASIIYKTDEIRKLVNTGQGSFKMRAKYRYVKSEGVLEIYEIPFSTTVEAIIDKVVENIKNGKIKEISDIRDETDLNGLKITLDLKRSTDPEKLMLKLFKMTSLEDSFSCNFNLLINGRPEVLGVKQIIKEWISFRIGCIKRQLSFDIAKLSKKLHLLYGLKKVLLDIDKAIKIIRNTEFDKDVVPNLMKAFEIDEAQSEYIAEIKLRNINKEYILKRTAEIEELEKSIEGMTRMQQSEKLIKKRIKLELNTIKKKYSKPRKTDIIHEDEVVTIEDEIMVEDYNLKLFLTDHNYIKKISLVSLRASNNHKLKDDDDIVQEVDSTNLSDVLIFSDKCNVYKMKAHEINDNKASDLGTYLPNIVELEHKDEQLMSIVSTLDYSGYMIFIFESGKVAKVPLSSYATKTNRKKLIKAYSDKSKIIKIIYITEDIDILINRFSSPDEIRFILVNTELIPEKTTKNTQGIQVVRMKKKSTVNLAGTIEEMGLADPEHFRVDRIPMSGNVVDLVEKMELMNKIK